MSPWKSAVIALVVTSAAALLWFGPRPAQSPPARRVVVEYWEKWTGDDGAQLQQIIDRYNNTQGAKQGIFVQSVLTSAISQKLLVATAAGVPPDIAGTYDAYLVQFACLDALEPLDELVDSGRIKPGDYKPVYWKALHWNGHLYGLVSTPATVALIYNKQILQANAAALRAAHLDPNRAPTSIDELDAYAKVLDKIDSSGNIQSLGYLPLEPGWFVKYSYLWFGGDIWDAEHHHFTLTDPRVVASFQWLQSYTKRLGVDSMNEFRSGATGGPAIWASPLNPFFAGTVAMIQQGPWVANYILNFKPSLDGLTDASQEDLNEPASLRRERDHWAVAPFPSAVAGLKDVTFAPFDCVCIPKGARHKKEALDFLAYMNRQDVMENLCNMHGANSPLANVSENFLEHHKNPYVGVFEELAKSPNAHGMPQIPIMPEVVDELNDLVQRVTVAQQDPATVLLAAQERLQKQYDTFIAEQKQRHAQ